MLNIANDFLCCPMGPRLTFSGMTQIFTRSRYTLPIILRRSALKRKTNFSKQRKELMDLTFMEVSPSSTKKKHLKGLSASNDQGETISRQSECKKNMISTLGGNVLLLLLFTVVMFALHRRACWRSLKPDTEQTK